MKVLIAVPTFETICPETFKSIYGLRGCDYLPLFDFVRGYDCARARNLICKEAIDGGFDYVLMVDSDVVLPDTTLEHMLSEQRPVTLGVYPRKGTQWETELFKVGTKDFVDRFAVSEVPPTTFEVKGGGMGCALISVPLLRDMGSGWFKYVEYPSGDVLSEDLYFCDRVSKMGASIVADGRVRCGHAWRETRWC